MFDKKPSGADRLEELKKRLYGRGGMGRKEVKESHLREHGSSTPSSWEHPDQENIYSPEEKKKSSLFQKFFIASAIFFVLALSYAGYQLLIGGNIVSSRNITLEVSGPAFVAGGDEISLQVSIANKNSVSLELAELFVEYPRGAGSNVSATSSDKERVHKSLPKISSGETYEEVMKFTLYGEGGSDKELLFIFEYRVKGSNAIFRKETKYPIRINSAPLNLSVQIPNEINTSQDLPISITASSNSPNNVSDIALEVEYPNGFSFVSAEPKPSSGNNVWRLGDFSPESKKTIKIIGSLSGEEGEERNFRISVGQEDSSGDEPIAVIYNSLFEKVTVRRPFLEARMVLDGSSLEIIPIQSRRTIRGDIFWKNTLPVRITDASIEVRIGGNALDRSSVSSDRGFYDSGSNTAFWNKGNFEEFQIIEPGESGRISFTLSALPLYNSQTGLLRNPEITFDIKTKGSTKTSTSDGVVEASSRRVARVASDFQLLSRIFYYSGPFKNTGPIPPKAESDTTYTTVWTVTNSANDANNSSVSAVLPSYVKWLGNVSPSSEDVSFDEGSGMVTWRMGTVSAGAGYGSEPREVAFQVRFTPSLSQIGKVVDLSGEQTLLGKDSFAGVELRSNRSPVSTTLSNDPGYKAGDNIVTK